MKKKKPVTRAGYLSKNPTGATFPSLQKHRVKNTNKTDSEFDTERVDRVGMEETDLTRRNHFLLQETKPLP
jgi:hypothetical protein